MIGYPLRIVAGDLARGGIRQPVHMEIRRPQHTIGRYGIGRYITLEIESDLSTKESAE